MIGNFTFHNPTKLHFGEDSLNKLSEELTHYGKKVMLCYGGGSIKRNGIYDQVMAELKKAGCEVVSGGDCWCDAEPHDREGVGGCPHGSQGECGSHPRCGRWLYH